MTAHVALLIDGDNFSPAYQKDVFKIAARFGTVQVARAYMDVTRPSPWSKCAQLQVLHAGTGKNASDLLMTIEAMDLLFQNRFDVFVLATSDGDFAHIARRLRQDGVQVIGVGEAKAPDSFRAACSLFECVGSNTTKDGHDPQPSGVDRKLHQLIKTHSTQGQGVLLTKLAPMMYVKHGVKISNMPERTWRSYLLARPALFDLDPRGPEAKVRFIAAAFQS